MSWTSRLASLLDSAESTIDTPAKLDTLRGFYQTILGDKEEEREGADSLFAEFLPRLFELQSDESPPVRKIVSEIIGEIGMKRVELVPEIVPVLMRVVEDPTPAVAKQAIKCGICLFQHTLRKIALQGLYTSELGEMLKSSWVSVQEFKEKILSLAFQAGSGGVRLLALKSLEAVILLYTPDPNGTHEPPVPEGDSLEFNISWVRGGHPVLNAGDLSIEASKMLNLLLDPLRLPTIKSLSNLVIIVLTKSLATIAKKRPPYYGRILPVLLGVDPSNSVLKGTHAYGARLALKNAFLSCLNCTHPGAAPWRERLAGALREVKLGGVAEEILHQTSNPDENKEEHETKGNFLDVKEEKPLIMLGGDATSILGRKRSGPEDDVTSVEDNDLTGKRARSMSTDSEGPLKDSCESAMDIKEDTAGSAGKSSTDDSGPVQQLVAMFGALVAQGEKAVGSLEILISSISADLLAEVVMANMRHLPPSQSYAEGDDVSLVNMTMKGSDSEAKYPPSFLAGVLSLSTSYPQAVSRLHVNSSIPDKTTAPKIEEERLELPDHAFDDNSDHHIGEVEPEIPPPSSPLSSNDTISKMEEEILPSTSYIHEVDDLDGEIPGLDSSARSDRISENTRTSSIISADFEDANREQFVSVNSRSSLDVHPSTSTERSEELSPKGAATDASSIVSSAATSTGLHTIVVLPKMSAPVVNLDDGQKDQLQSLAFVSIIDAYKHIAVAGGSQVRFSLLAYLGVEFPSDVDPWKPLQNHILSDYINLEGHELTLRVLYRLFSEVEEDRDFFSSTTAATAYEMFLLTVAEALRESFPPSDKSLSKLLGEAPYLPKSILNLLESLCCPGNSDKTEESHSGDRVTQGLSTVWSLILHRPPLRESCLKIALQSAVHHSEEVRMKAIRLVANKLFPLPTISQQIEDFAKEKLVSVAQVDVADGTDADGSNTESQKDPVLEKQSNENQAVSAISRDVSSDTHQSCTSKSISSLSTSEAQRCMSLYFALCTKKHSLFRHVFLVYKSASKAVKQAVRLHIPILVRTIGSSSGLLEIISDPPLGSEELLLQVLQTLTDRIVPSPELLATIRKLYDTKLKDAEILIPILPFLPRDEVLVIFPQLVNLPPVKFQAALAHILQGSSHSGAVLTPAEVLIAIHGIDPDRDAIPLKKVTDACNACFEQPQIFTQQVIAKVLNQLVEQIPLPLLFMRTVLQAIGAYPALVDFVLEILSRLVSKQIWKYPKLWVGFLRCAFLTKPQSFSVLLQLPPPQLENALNRTPALKAPLVAHASQPNIKSSLPRSVLGVLGIVTDAPTASQAQTVDTSNSDKEAHTEVTKESSNAT